MYDYIKGKPISLTPTHAIIENNNIGYKINIAINTFSKIDHKKEEIILFTSLIIREDSHTLYGFISKEERDLFELLITVSGVGPKTAMSLIGHLTINVFYSAIKQNDPRLMSKVPGIGKKTAQRLIIEMSDKLKFFKDSNNSLIEEKGNIMITDAINALINLGYNPMKAQKAVNLAMEKGSLNDTGSLISYALKNI